MFTPLFDVDIKEKLSKLVEDSRFSSKSKVNIMCRNYVRQIVEVYYIVR